MYRPNTKQENAIFPHSGQTVEEIADQRDKLDKLRQKTLDGTDQAVELDAKIYDLNERLRIITLINKHPPEPLFNK